MEEIVVAGIDGCRGGWCLVTGRGLQCALKIEVTVHTTFALAVDAAKDALHVAVDIPIGLGESGSRACDLVARQALGVRWMCVFSAPPRPVLVAETYSEASRIHRELCSKGMSRQAFGIMPKIAEVDHYLRSQPGSAERVWELHPEISFAALNGGVPLLLGKATKDGLRARRGLLRRFVSGLDVAVAFALETWPRRLLKEDDVLDAVVACVTAATWRPEATISVVGEERDACGLPIQMRRPSPRKGDARRSP